MRPEKPAAFRFGGLDAPYATGRVPPQRVAGCLREAAAGLAGVVMCALGPGMPLS